MSLFNRRLGARAAVVAGVAIAGPLMFAGAALACSPPSWTPPSWTPPSWSTSSVQCLTGTSAIKVDSFDASAGTAVVELASGACPFQVVTLADYEITGTSTFPQTLFSKSTVVLWSGQPTTIHVQLPPCAGQLDLVSGIDVPQTLTGLYFTPAGTLLYAGDTGSGVCPATPPCHK